ncbi:hypothetical protein SAV14893_077260 [Streptomyces avermitilis]|uniref:Uncharacterized protein n=1 Tax=Streptomyces avermitilis TaxID=33903 RepID=A0A4D4MHY1_STRAX|nr:hypothetical protein SAV14893_077260 [Streptomyces avermitilis]GDY71305.1 hypothetical protein SAV31267_007900 [Streptomyces avermitilis]
MAKLRAPVALRRLGTFLSHLGSVAEVTLARASAILDDGNLALSYRLYEVQRGLVGCFSGALGRWRGYRYRVPVGLTKGRSMECRGTQRGRQEAAKQPLIKG